MEESKILEELNVFLKTNRCKTIFWKNFKRENKFWERRDKHSPHIRSKEKYLQEIEKNPGFAIMIAFLWDEGLKPKFWDEGPRLFWDKVDNEWVKSKQIVYE